MKKVWLLMFIPSFSFAAQQITQQQAQTVQAVVPKMGTDLQQLQVLALQANLITLNGNTYTLAGSTVSYAITAAQNQDIVNYYESLKNDICNIQCSALP